MAEFVLEFFLISRLIFFFKFSSERDFFQCRQLELKKEKLESDKATLMQTIVQLDRKKEKEIFKAHEKVNRVNYFSLKIFLNFSL